MRATPRRASRTRSHVTAASKGAQSATATPRWSTSTGESGEHPREKGCGGGHMVAPGIRRVCAVVLFAWVVIAPLSLWAADGGRAPEQLPTETPETPEKGAASLSPSELLREWRAVDSV